MSEENESLVQRLWNQIWIEGALDELDQIVTDPYVRHTRDGTVSASPVDYASHIESMVRMIRGTEVTVDHIASSDDIVFARLNLRAVNLSTGDNIKITWLTQYRVAEGRIAESWTMHQTGLDW